jgi:hypothetical protein
MRPMSELLRVLAVRSCATCAHYEPVANTCDVTQKSVTGKMIGADWRPASRLMYALAVIGAILTVTRLVAGSAMLVSVMLYASGIGR